MSDDLPDPVSDFTTSKAMGRGSTVSAERPDVPGKGLRLGRYTTQRLLGRGGMAEVYLAHQDGPAGFQKTCVIKRMRRILAEEPRFVEMFLREARVAARLNHANVVQIFELGQSEGEYFIAMEYLDGISLHKAARRCWSNNTSIPMEVALRAVADAALGLHHAHTQRDGAGRIAPLVHRDVSPDNLVVTRDGITKVLDFGIAKANSEVDEVTKTGELKGKIPYMSPEQIRGDTLDGRSDMWSLGVSLYWLLTGKRPFDGGTDHMTIDHILRSNPTPPRELNGLIPIGLENVILSLLQKDPAHRIGSGLALRERLVTLLGPASGPGPASSFCNRVMDMPATEKKVGPNSVLTIIAARPETQWLQRVSAGGAEHADLLSLVPNVSQTAQTVVPGGPVDPHVDTAETVTNVSVVEFDFAEPSEPSRIGAIAAGLLLFTVLAGAGFWLITGDSSPDNAPPRTEPLVAENAPPSENAPTHDVGATNQATRAEAPDEKGEPLTAPGGTDAPETSGVASAVTDDAATAKAPPETAKKSGRRTATRKASARGVSLQVRGPASITWRTPRGRRLRRGPGKVTAPKGTDTLLAVDATTGGTTRVDVRDGIADLSTAGSGRLSLRIRPWATASIGGRKLGTTPMDAVVLPAGRYKVKLVWQDKVRTETVTIRRGKQATLKIDMRQP